MSNPSINEAKAIAKKHDKEIVIIFHISNNNFGYVSYGKDKLHCNKAKTVADLCTDIIINHPDICK